MNKKYLILLVSSMFLVFGISACSPIDESANIVTHENVKKEEKFEKITNKISENVLSSSSMHTSEFVGVQPENSIFLEMTSNKFVSVKIKTLKEVSRIRFEVEYPKNVKIDISNLKVGKEIPWNKNTKVVKINEKENVIIYTLSAFLGEKPMKAGEYEIGKIFYDNDSKGGFQILNKEKSEKLRISIPGKKIGEYVDVTDDFIVDYDVSSKRK